MSQVVGSNSSYKPITNTVWVRTRLCKLQKGCTQLPAASDKVYQLLAHGRWFSPGTPASSTTKTGRHDIAEILLKVALNTKNQIKSNLYITSRYSHFNILFSKPCQRQYELLPSLDVRRLSSFAFHILILFSENPQPNELKDVRKHQWKVLSKDCTFCPNPLTNMVATGNSCF